MSYQGGGGGIGRGARRTMIAEVVVGSVQLVCDRNVLPGGVVAVSFSTIGALVDWGWKLFL